MPDPTPFPGLSLSVPGPSPHDWSTELTEHWRIIEVRRGGMGEVFICEPAEGDLKTRIAFKTYAPHLFFEPAAHQAFRRECVLWMRLTMAPYVMPAIAVAYVGDRPYIGMPAVDGDLFSLRQVIEHGLTEAEAITHAFEVAQALAACAERVDGFVHGDLKPSNVLMLDGRAHVSDFGLSHIAAGTDANADIPAYGALLFQLADACASGAEGLRKLANQCMTPDGLLQDFESVRTCVTAIAAESGVVLPDWRQLKDWNNFGSLLWLPRMLAALVDLKEYELALETAQLVPEPARTAQVWLLLGIALSMLGREQEALECYDQADAVPCEADIAWQVMSNRALSLKHLGRFDDAIALLEPLVHLVEEPAATRLAANLAGVHLAAGHLTQASQIVARVLRRNPRDPLCHRLAAEVHQARRDPAAALESALTAANLGPLGADNHRVLADILLDVGDVRRAIPVIESMFTLGGTDLTLLSKALALTAFQGDDTARREVIGLLRQHADDELVEQLETDVDAIAEWARQQRPPSDEKLGSTSPDHFEQLLTTVPADKVLSVVRSVPGEGPIVLATPQATDDTEPYTQLAMSPDGFVTMDFYSASEDPDRTVALFLRAYNEIRHLSVLEADTRMRGTQFQQVHCPSCSAGILSNRPPGKRFMCQRCGSTVTAEGSPSPLADRVNEVTGRAIGTRRYVVGFGAQLADQKELRKATKVAVRHGWQPITLHSLLGKEVVIEGTQRGALSVNAPLLLCRLVSHNRPADTKVMDQDTERLVAALRNRFGSISSFSIAQEAQDDTPVNLMLLGRLSDAHQALVSGPDDPGYSLLWVQLGDEALETGDTALAENAARTAVRRSPGLGSAWLLLAQVELARRNPAAGLVAAERAAALDPLSAVGQHVKYTAATLVGDHAKAAEAVTALNRRGLRP